MAWTLQTAPGSGAIASNATSLTAAFTESTAGTTLIAVFGISAGIAITVPSGWIQAELQAGDGESGIWYYPDNPGGLSSVEFQWTGSNSAQANVAEFSPAGGMSANLTAGSAAASAETLTVTTASDPSPGDLGISVFYFGGLSSAADVTWTTPANWSLISANSADYEWHIASYYYIGVPSGATLSVQGEVATTQPKLSGALATFSLVPAAAATASLALSATATGKRGSSARSGTATDVAALIAAGLI